MKKILFAITILASLSSCVSPLDPGSMQKQMGQFYAAHEQKQKQAYAEFLQQQKGQPVKTGYLRFQNFTSQTFTVSLIHPDTQQVYHTITLPPQSSGWFPTADNTQKVTVGSDWALSTTMQNGQTHFQAIAQQQYCSRVEGTAYLQHYGVDQSFWNCQAGLGGDPDSLTKYALFSPAPVNTANQPAASSSANHLLAALTAKPQTTPAKPAVSAAPAPQEVAQAPNSDKEIIIHEDFSDESEFALIGRESFNKYSGRKGKVKKGKNYIEAWGSDWQKFIFTDKKRMDWASYNYPLDLTKDFEYEVVFDLSKAKDPKGTASKVCQVIGASENHKSYITFCMMRKDGAVLAYFDGKDLPEKIPLSEDHIYTLTSKKIDGQFYLYINQQLLSKDQLPTHVRLGGPNFGISFPVAYNGYIVGIDSFTLSYLNNQTSRFPKWEISSTYGYDNNGTLSVYNYEPSKMKLTLWDPVTKNKYSDYYVNPEGYYIIKEKNNSNKLKVNGNWGVQFEGQSESEIKAIYQVATFDRSNPSAWKISRGDYAESQKRKAEAIAEQKRLEATPEYQAEQARKRVASCRSYLEYQQNDLKDLINKSAKPICESDFDIAMTSHNNGTSLEWLRKSCLSDKVKYMRRDFDDLKSRASNTTSKCKAAGIDAWPMEQNIIQTVSLLESQYNSRVSSMESAVRARDEAGSNRIAAEKRAHEAQMEANFQEWAGRMRGQDYNSFLDSIGHDSSSTGVTAQAQQAVREYAQAQQKQREIQQDYTKLLAQVEQQTKAIDSSASKTLTPQEQCARDKQKDSRLYWDIRNNKCMIKMYENTQNNMKDIGVSYTNGSSTANNTTSNDRVDLTGSKGLEAGSVNGGQASETLYFLEHGNSYLDPSDGGTLQRPSVGSKIHGDTIVAYREAYEPIFCPNHHVKTWYIVITKRTVNTFAYELEKMKKRDDVFTSLKSALTSSIPRDRSPYYTMSEAMSAIAGKTCGSGGASQQ